MQAASERQPAGHGGRAIDVIASAGDRDRAFRRARRHSWLVRLLKLALPTAVLASLGAYGVALVATSGFKGNNASVGKITIDPTNLTMADPRYSGFAKDGAQYKVHAKSAVTDLRNSAPIRLNEIDGELSQVSGTVTKMTARWGTYDQKKDLLELYDKIDIDGSDGMTARLTRATVFTKEGRILSDQPVWASNETSEIRAKAMALDQKARKGAFRGDVEVTLKPRPPVPAAGEAKPARQVVAIPGLETASGEPVAVTAAALDLDDTARTALFRENVVARQGEAMLVAPELDVLYLGKASLGAAATKPAGAPTAPKDDEQTRLKWIAARGGVVMTNKDSRAESATFDYDALDQAAKLEGNVVMTQGPGRRATAGMVLLDQKVDTVLMTGDVVITQERNVLKAGQAVIDRRNGTAKLTTPAVNGRQAGRISTLLFQGQAGGQKAKPQPEKADNRAGETGPGALGPLGAGFKSDPNAPIEVEAASLDVHDRQHKAIYAGAVVAKQGNFVVRTEEMTAYYAGETGLLSATPASGAPSAAKSKAPGGGAGELKRIEARRAVVVTGTDGQQATGEWANFDAKANTVVMGGKVVVSQGKQIVRAPEGMRLLIDLGSGLTSFEADPAATTAKTGAQVSGAFATSVAPSPDATVANPAGCPPGAVCRSGRLEAIIYPNQIKEKAKAAAPGLEDAAKAAVKRVPKAAGRGGEASSWSSTSSPTTGQ